MSRAYRIRVNESERRVIRAADEVRTSLGLLDVLPREEMAALLEHELLGRGFRKDGDLVRRDDDGVSVTVDPATGAVTARAEAEETARLQTHREGLAYDDLGPSQRAVRRELKERARADIEQQAVHAQHKVQGQATERLEGQLLDLKRELDVAVNRATAAALKRKAAQLGQVKSIQENADSGEVSITVEV
jgi:hypothetical protein